ncbi:MAG TPA: ThiF family adenylyltransferase [Flavitalea sp.]|nr:ThiF family adenylyltransferase [Flavitalea sp.]
MVSASEFARYSRHLALPGFGIEGQEKLKAARVLVVGAGGLGCPLLQYLAAAGIGTIGIIDHDIVSLSNLQRQVLFSVQDIGKKKAEVAREKLHDLNPIVIINAYPEKLASRNALSLFAQYDVIADCSDNFPTRYLVNDAAVLSGKPYVYGSVFRFEGQVAVFNQVLENSRRSGNYRDLYPQPPLPGEVPNCEDAGVLGASTGIIGTLQALMIIKLLAGISHAEPNTYHLFDAVRMEMKSMRFKSREDNPLTGIKPSIQTLQDYELFCGIKSAQGLEVKQITGRELLQLRESNTAFQLIDVREQAEYDQFNIGGSLVPLSTLTDHIALIRKDIPVIIYCQSGQRSMQAVARLQSEYQFHNLLNLSGGIAGLNAEV